MDPVLYGPGEGEHHDAGAAQIIIKAAGEHTGGSFFLAESTLAPGFAGPPPHRHRELHDMFYVLDGTLTLRLGDRTIEAGPGNFACVPPGVVHTFRNSTDEEARVISVVSPAGLERYYQALAELPEGPPDINAIKEIMADFGLQLRIPG